MNLDYDMKFGDAFPNLRGVDLATEEFDFPVRIHNILKRCKINTLHELLVYSCNDILNDGGAPWLIDHIVHKLDAWHTIYTRTKKTLKERLRSISEDEKRVIELDVFLPIFESKESLHQYLDVDILPIKATERAIDEMVKAQATADFYNFLSRIYGFINHYSERIFEEEENEQNGLSFSFAFFRKSEENLPVKDATLIVVRIFTHLQSRKVAQLKSKKRTDEFEEIVAFNKDESSKFEGYRASYQELVRLIREAECS
jgi:hypothetical protein